MTIEKLCSNAEFVVLFDGENGQMVRPFISTDLDADFYSALKRTFEERCPEVKWTQVYWENLKRR